MFRIERYLDRIGLTDVPPGAAGLAAVQEAHMRAIAFENIDPLLGAVPSLALDDIERKLVAGRRGGYCFEHNALFGRALQALGYAPRPLLARVFTASGQAGARTHQAFEVEAEGATWLCDTGFGGHGALAPVRLGTSAHQLAPNGTYRVRQATGDETVLERQAGGNWVPQYGFHHTPVQPVDFEAANFLCARWEGAPFSANLMLAFHGRQERIALFNRGLSIGLSPDSRQRRLSSAADLARILREHCALDIDDERVAQVWEKIEHAPTRR